MKIKIAIPFFILSCVALSSLQAATPEDEGRKIAEAADATQRGFKSESVGLKMLMISAAGDTVTRQMKTITLERPKQDDFSLTQFLEPADVRGTGLLTYQNPKGDDQQWLYLPELRRVKVIASKNKSGAFMGSEFTYEDITANALDKFSYKKIGEESLNGVECYVLEKYPIYKNSGYTKIKQWITKKDHLLSRVEFTDRKNSILKVQTFQTWKQYGNIWRVSQIEMNNLQTHKKSILLFSDRKIDVGLNESNFTQQSLQRLL